MPLEIVGMDLDKSRQQVVPLEVERDGHGAVHVPLERSAGENDLRLAHGNGHAHADGRGHRAAGAETRRRNGRHDAAPPALSSVAAPAPTSRRQVSARAASSAVSGVTRIAETSRPILRPEED